MFRRLALIAAFLVAGHASASAQHPGMPGMHGQIDSAQHAMLHKLMHGNWSGTFSSPHGNGDLDLAVLHDSLMQSMSFQFSGSHFAHVGAAKDFSLRGDTLVWTQQLPDGPCNARAVVTPATERAPDTMQGTMDCDGHTVSFLLQRKMK